MVDWKTDHFWFRGWRSGEARSGDGYSKFPLLFMVQHDTLTLTNLQLVEQFPLCATIPQLSNSTPTGETIRGNFMLKLTLL